MTPNDEATQPKGRRVTIDLTPAAAKEVDRLRQVTGLTTADLFRHAMTLFRVVVEVKQRGEELYIVDPRKNRSDTRLEFPITVAAVEV